MEAFTFWFNQWEYTTGVLIGLISIGFHCNNKPKYAFALLIVSATLLGYSAIHIDGYLHLWDERFHALVAKSQAVNPFVPKLFPENIEVGHPNAHRGWNTAYIWLHKPPFFTGLMGLSIKVFGLKIWATRIPSYLLYVLSGWALYKGTKLISNKNTAFICMLLWVLAWYNFELIAGYEFMDHNQMILTTLVVFIFWIWAELKNKPSLLWALFGGFILLAIYLTKSYPGLFVLLPLGTLLLYQRKWLLFIPLLLPLLIGGYAWGTWCANQFPIVHQIESEYTFRHLFEALEGHKEPWYYHFAILLKYNKLHFIGVLFMGLGIYLQRKKWNDGSSLMMWFYAIVAVYFIFTLAQTKMPGYALMTLPILFCFMAMGIQFIMDKWLRNKSLQLTFILLIAMAQTGFYQVEKNHDQHSHNPNYTQRSKAVQAWPINTNTIVFNVPDNYFVNCMFFHPGLAYWHLPDDKILNNLESQGYKILFFESANQPLGAAYDKYEKVSW